MDLNEKEVAGGVPTVNEAPALCGWLLFCIGIEQLTCWDAGIDWLMMLMASECVRVWTVS